MVSWLLLLAFGVDSGLSPDLLRTGILEAAQNLGLPLPEAIELRSSSQRLLPDGRLELPRSGLMQTAPGEYLWRGSWHYGGLRSLPVWVRFHTVARVKTLRAIARVPAGTEVSSVWAEEVDEIGSLLSEPLSLESAKGLHTRRGVAAGSRITLHDLAAPNLIKVGEVAEISVRGYGTELRFTAKAAQTGALDQVILFENPFNRRRFAAVITGPGQAEVRTASRRTNP
jgi:hypothetical protein